MIPARVLIPFVGAVSAFGAFGAALALMGAGVPFPLAALGTSAAVGLVLRGLMPAAAAAPGQDAAAQARLDAAEARASSLRHDLRGALSPALIFSDRLAASTDPAIRKAGETVALSIERASALIAASKDPEPPGDGAARKPGGAP